MLEEGALGRGWAEQGLRGCKPGPALPTLSLQWETYTVEGEGCDIAQREGVWHLLGVGLSPTVPELVIFELEAPWDGVGFHQLAKGGETISG